jgi:DNA-directed RNA polymerase subunit RPC12/RpoP
MTAATLPAPEPSPAADRCANCGRLVDGLLRGRCKTCQDYWRRFGRERPARLWKRERPAPVWEPVEAGEAGPWCDCQRPAVWKVTVPISETARARLYLCSKCAELEKQLSAGSSWSD